MNRCLSVALLTAAILLGVLGYFWINQPPSNQELLANTAKALDYAQGWRDVGGPPWWTPYFLQGTSLATAVSYLLSSLWILLWTLPFGIYVGPKIAALLCVWIGGLGVFFWARRLTQHDWLAAISSLAFVLCPSVHVRVAGYEHLVFVSAFAVIPWVLWSLTVFVETPTRRSGLIAGGLLALLLLTYAKAAALLLPTASIYAIMLWLGRKDGSRFPWAAAGIAATTVFVLGVLPNLPAAREMNLAVVFDLGPFDGWQQTFSLKSNILWFDRDAILSTGMASGFAATTARGGNYFGLVPGLLLIFLLWFRPSGLYDSRVGLVVRFLLGLFLFTHWLSFGPRPIILGQIEFLRQSFDAADALIALGWMLFLIQPWIIYQLLPNQMAGRHWIAGILSAAYLIVPGFRLISWLPLYSDLRAPHDFSQIVGVLFLLPAIGGAAVLLFQKFSWKTLTLIFPAALAFSILDISPYLRPYFASPMEKGVLADFQKAQDYLRTAPLNGWVQALSGRYFYLLTPHLSGRGLSSEAFNSYLMQNGVAYLQASAYLGPDKLRAWLNEGGVAYLLIDKTDPELDANLVERYTSILSKAYENPHFLILGNPASLSPGFVAQSFIGGDGTVHQEARVGLDLFKSGAILLPESVRSLLPGHQQIGRLSEKDFDLTQDFGATVPRPFLAIKNGPPLQSHYQSVTVPSATAAGWLVLPVAYHPDWQAFSGSAPVPVSRANGGLLAARIDRPDQPIEFRFSPPWWYNAFLALSAAGWLLWLILLLFGALPYAIFGGLRGWLRQSPVRGVPISKINHSPAQKPITDPIVIVPTYNEAANLPTTLEILLGADERLHVLIVDDNSPDGTADLVRKNPEFGKRLHLLSRAGKLGLGSAYRDGFQWAFSRDYDACLEMDADLSHDPRDVPRLLAALEDGADAAIGSRYQGGVRVMNWPEHRLLLSTTASRFVQLTTGMPISDATSGFKAIRTASLQRLNWSNFKTEGYGFQVELHYFLWRSGARIVEVPIVFTERTDGSTKMTIGIAIEAAVRTLQLALLSRSSHE